VLLLEDGLQDRLGQRLEQPTRAGQILTGARAAISNTIAFRSTSVSHAVFLIVISSEPMSAAASVFTVFTVFTVFPGQPESRRV
jgi:hypothetical protein